jgi:hypothetical protein
MFCFHEETLSWQRNLSSLSSATDGYRPNVGCKCPPTIELMKKIQLSLILILTLLISCQKKEKKKTLNRLQTAYVEFKVDFPDTVKLNKTYDGVIYFKSGLDSVITTFGDKKKNRYARFIVAKTHERINDVEELRKVVVDTFGALSNRKIPFYDIKFNKPGTYYLQGIIDDIVLIDTADTEFKPLLRNENYVFKKVYVTK